MHPAVRRYVAVDEVCVDRLVREEGIDAERVELLLNFVDLDRFRPRPALPDEPARALVLSNAATADGYARVIADGVSVLGHRARIVGVASRQSRPMRRKRCWPDTTSSSPKGRTALEALAVGCATVLADRPAPGRSSRRRTTNGCDGETSASASSSTRTTSLGIGSRSRGYRSRRRRRSVAPACATEAGMQPARSIVCWRSMKRRWQRLRTGRWRGGRGASAEPHRGPAEGSVRHPRSAGGGRPLISRWRGRSSTLRRSELAQLESSVRVLEQQLRAREHELAEMRDEEQALRGQIAAVQSVANAPHPRCGPQGADGRRVIHAGARRLAKLMRSEVSVRWWRGAKADVRRPALACRISVY